MNEQERIRGVTFAILLALHEAKIETYHSGDWNLPVKVAVGPTVFTLGVSLVEPSQTPKALKQAHAMNTYAARELDLGFGEQIQLRTYHQGAYLVVEAPRENPWRPTLLELEDKLQNEVLLGLNSHEIPFRIDLFARENPGLFFVGISGSGKTNAIRSVVAQGAEQGWLIGVIDMKGGRDWRGDLEAHARLGAAYNESDAVLLLEKVLKIADERNKRSASDDDKPILLVFDEIHKIDKKAPAQLLLAEICSICRSANVRVLAGSQRAGKEIEARITANLDTRLVGKVQSVGESFNASGVSGAGAESLQGKGDMLLVVDGRIEARLQVPRAEPHDVAHLLQPEAPRSDLEEPEEPKLQEPEPKPEPEQAEAEQAKAEQAEAEPAPEAEPKPAPEPQGETLTISEKWSKSNLHEVVDLLEKGIEAKKLELLKAKSRAKLPPLSLVVQAGFWAIRHNKLPVKKQLTDWLKAGKKKGVGSSKKDLVIQIVSETLGV